MTAPERRRPLPALAFIAALTLLTALVWFRVIHRTDTPAAAQQSCATSPSSSTTTGPTASAALKVLPVASKVTILVLNSTEKSNFAKSTAKLLVAKGFKVPNYTDDSAAYGGHGVIKGVGEIRYGPSAKAAATLLKYYVPAAKYVPTDSSSSTVIFALGAKFTTLRTIAQVQKLLAANHVTLTRGALPTPSASSTSSCAPGSSDTSTGGASTTPSAASS